MLNFKTIIGGSLSILCCSVLWAKSSTDTPSLIKPLTELEKQAHGIIGAVAINTGNHEIIQYHAEQRFPMQSTYKLVAVSAILKNSMQDPGILKKHITFTTKDIDPSWSPITEKHVAQGMDVVDLCAAAISWSDTTAMKLLIKLVGGFQNINTFAKSIGDNRYKLYDLDGPKTVTTTPLAMATSAQQLVLGDVLAPKQREALTQWLKETTTGKMRIRSALPKAWLAGDKTGSGIHYGTTNDVAVIWPPHCKPIVMAVYFTHPEIKSPTRPDIVAKTAKILLSKLIKNDECLKKDFAKG